MYCAVMKWRRTTSNGCPFRSYIARKKNGSMIMIIPMAASVMFPVFFRRKSGFELFLAAISKSIHFEKLRTERFDRIFHLVSGTAKIGFDGFDNVIWDEGCFTSPYIDKEDDSVSLSTYFCITI